MTTNSYIVGRYKYSRPQAMLWSNNPGSVVVETSGSNQSRFYIPNGYEVGAEYPENATEQEIDQFLILSDHNRSPMNISYERIENRQRTVNGVMRSRHIADKLKISVSWDMLPSRAFSGNPFFDTVSGRSILSGNDSVFTADGGAGGNNLLDWYDSHPGPFWVFLAYDKIDSSESVSNRYNTFFEYTQVLQMYITNFTYSIQKRSASLYDMWNISVDLEEV